MAANGDEGGRNAVNAEGPGAVAVGRRGVHVGGPNLGSINTGTQIAGDYVRGDKIYITIGAGDSTDDVLEKLRTSGSLRRLTTRLPEEPFRRLLDIVAQIALPDIGAHLYRACRATLPPTAHLVNSEVPAVLLADMCDQPLTKPWPSLFECLERLTLLEQVTAAHRDALGGWVDASAALVTPPTTLADVKQMRREVRDAMSASAAPDAFSWLQVYLEPDWRNRTQERKQPLFRVELVLWSPQTNGALVLPSGPDEARTGEAARLWTLDDLPRLLDEVFARAETVALIPNIRRLIIEVVAPSDSLLHGFERWKQNNTSKTYGVDYPVVVRLRDRQTIPNPAEQKRADDYWRSKWNVFRNDPRFRGGAGSVQLEWRAEQELDAIELQDDDDLVCLGLSSPLMKGCREAFDALRDAGIPIAIWMRGCDLGSAAPPDWRARVSELILGKPLSNLREAIQEVRRSRDARRDPAHFCNALTLLWDDPDRPPLKYEAQGVFV